MPWARRNSETAADSDRGDRCRVGQRLVDADRPEVADRPSRDQHDDHADVHHLRRRPEEVVVVDGDELADLVEEQAEADPADGDRRHANRRAQKQPTHDERDHEQARSPDRVRDVQRVATDLWIPGELQIGAGDQNRGNGDDQEPFDIRTAPNASGHPAGCGHRENFITARRAMS